MCIFFYQRYVLMERGYTYRLHNVLMYVFPFLNVLLLYISFFKRFSLWYCTDFGKGCDTAKLYAGTTNLQGLKAELCTSGQLICRDNLLAEIKHGRDQAGRRLGNSLTGRQRPQKVHPKTALPRPPRALACCLGPAMDAHAQPQQNIWALDLFGTVKHCWAGNLSFGLQSLTKKIHK